MSKNFFGYKKDPEFNNVALQKKFLTFLEIIYKIYIKNNHGDEFIFSQYSLMLSKKIRPSTLLPFLNDLLQNSTSLFWNVKQVLFYLFISHIFAVFIFMLNRNHKKIVKSLFAVNVLFFFLFLRFSSSHLLTLYFSMIIFILLSCIYEDSLVRKANSFGNYRCSNHESRNNKNNYRSV